MNRKRIFLALIISTLMVTALPARVRGGSVSSNKAAGISTQAQLSNKPSVKALGNSAFMANDDDDELVGSWRATFNPIPGDPVQFPPLPALFTFTSDGTLVETDGGSLVPSIDIFASPGHGVWRSTGKHTFELKNIIIVVNSDGTLFLTGTIRLKVKVSADGNSFQGNGTFSFVDSNGVDFGSGPESISGKRIRFN